MYTSQINFRTGFFRLKFSDRPCLVRERIQVQHGGRLRLLRDHKSGRAHLHLQDFAGGVHTTLVRIQDELIIVNLTVSFDLLTLHFGFGPLNRTLGPFKCTWAHLLFPIIDKLMKNTSLINRFTCEWRQLMRFQH